MQSRTASAQFCSRASSHFIIFAILNVEGRPESGSWVYALEIEYNGQRRRPAHAMRLVLP